MKSKDVITFWRDIEIFHLPDLPKEAKQPGDRLPWELPFTPDDKFTIRHIVFFGKQKKEHIVRQIEKLIDYVPGEEQEWQEREVGTTCMAALILNEKGQLVNDTSYVQTSYLHGLACLREKGDLSDISHRLELAQQKFNERHPYNTEARTFEQLQLPAFNWDMLNNEVRVLNDLRIPDIICSEELLIHSYKVSKKNLYDAPFLNSFYLDDLNNLISAPTKWGRGLKDYTKPHIDENSRLNVLENAQSFFDSIDPAQIPAGRWPYNPEHGLYAAQAAALQTALRQLQNGGLSGINGPPGTGKTTLLSDVVAHVVTERARQLLKVPDHNLFGQHGKISRVPRDAYYYHPLETIFSDIGIVVASNNNSAVENISKVLPDRKKIDTDSFPQADFFSTCSQKLITGESWGALAAALGNSENRRAFKDNFWYSEKGLGLHLYELYKDVTNDRAIEYREKIKEQKQELTKLLKLFSTFQKLANIFYSALPQQIADIGAKPIKEEELHATISAIRAAEDYAHELDTDLQRVIGNLRETMDRITFHRSISPWPFCVQRLFKTQRYSSWNASYLVLQRQYHNGVSERATLEQEITQLHRKIRESEKQKVDIEREIAQIDSRMLQHQERKVQLHIQYEIEYVNLPDEDLYRKFRFEKELFHVSNPWSSKKINKLRTEIFLVSLKLHEYYILANAKQFRNNLELLMEHMEGKVELSASLASMLWRTFFFCIPVVSTSLASVGRLFKGLGMDSIAWLLIDEAGQATPQSTAGIIGRSRRSIIIGDPMQLEPVVKVPDKLLTMLRKQHNVDTAWSPLHSSAQSLADRISLYGTYMEVGTDDPIWSGFPLRAHRRCNEPMFSVANKIAYNGQMVKAADDVEFKNKIPPSTWFHIAGTTVENGQVVTEEITALRARIQTLGAEQNIFVISPFKSVARACDNATGAHIQCGTIHTFQGKEADIVFLVLGSDPARPGSRAWASQRPNMLNVALTRAKKRIYVIGNRKLWKDLPYFNVLDRELT